jgi:hypothetical protein
MMQVKKVKRLHLNGEVLPLEQETAMDESTSAKHKCRSFMLKQAMAVAMSL